MNKQLLQRVVATALGLVMVRATFAAESYNYNNVLIGEKAAGIGGAFVAVADSVEATFYNPAGLVLGDMPYASISAQLYERRTVRGKLFYRDDELIESSSFVPNFWGVVKELGSGSLAFSIIIPEYTAYELSLKYHEVDDFISGFTFHDLRLDKNEATQYYRMGPSYAIKLGDKLSIGASAFYTFGEITENQSLYWNYSIYEAGTNNVLRSGYNLSESSIDGNASGFSVLFGALYSVSERTNLGFSIHTPQNLAKDIEVTHQVFDITNDVSAGAQYNVTNIKYDSQYPWQTRAGFAHRFSERNMISYQLDYFHGVDYEIKSVIRTASGYEVVKQSIVREPVLNHAFGYEHMFDDSTPLRFGIYTNNSAAPEVPELATSSSNNHIDITGITLSSGIVEANTTLIYGLGVASGKGGASTRNMIDLISELEPTWERKELEYVALTAFLSGSYMF